MKLPVLLGLGALLLGGAPPFCALAQTPNGGASAPARAPVGMVAVAQGQVWRGEGAARVPLRSLERLSAGTRLQTGPASSAVVVLFEGGQRFALGAGAGALVGASDVVGARRLPALAGASAATVRRLGAGRVGAVSARPPHSFARLAPDAPPFFPLQSPTLCWMEFSGASHYSLALFDGDDHLIWSQSTAQTQLAPPAEAPLLPRRPYLWRLSAFGPSGKPLPGARWGWLTFLDEADARELSDTLAQLRELEATDASALWLQVAAFRAFGVANGALELLTGPLLGHPDAAPVRDEILSELSPFSRALAAQGHS